MRVTKWESVADTLRAEIQRQGMSYDVPGEYKAMHRFEVSRVTVRRAFQQLQDEGLLVVVPGRGRKVTRR